MTCHWHQRVDRCRRNGELTFEPGLRVSPRQGAFFCVQQFPRRNSPHFIDVIGEVNGVMGGESVAFWFSIPTPREIDLLSRA